MVRSVVYLEGKRDAGSASGQAAGVREVVGRRTQREEMRARGEARGDEEGRHNVAGRWCPAVKKRGMDGVATAGRGVFSRSKSQFDGFPSALRVYLLVLLGSSVREPRSGS